MYLVHPEAEATRASEPRDPRPQGLALPLPTDPQTAATTEDDGHPSPPLSPSPAERCYPAPTGLSPGTDPTKLPRVLQAPVAALEQNHKVELQELITPGISKSSQN